MTTVLERYAGHVTAAITAIARDEVDSVRAAAAIVAAQLQRDGLVYIYGPGGHSALAAQDVFYRAGCPANVVPVMDPATTLLGRALSSTGVERTAGHGAAVVAASGVGAGDPFIVVNAFGINAAALDAARAARARRARVIALSSRAAAVGLPLDHPARSAGADDLSVLADVHVDTHVPAGDVVLDVGGGTPAGGVSTALNSFVLHAILATALDAALDTAVGAAGGAVRVWRSGYTVGGDAHNAAVADAVRERVPQL